MKTLIMVLLLGASSSAFAAEETLERYLEKASQSLGINIDASTFAGDTQKQDFPELSQGTSEQRMAMLLSSLSQLGITLVHDSRSDVYQALKLRNARDEAIPFFANEDAGQLPDNDLLVTHEIKLEHFPAEALARTLRSFAPANSRLVPSEGNRALFVTDAARSMAKYREISRKLDTPKSAEEAWADLKERAQEMKCPGETVAASTPFHQNALLVTLLSLVALFIGFILRGYMIRRIEGGL